MHKDETQRTHLTFGGERIDYSNDKINPTSDLTTPKCLINSTLSTPNEKYLVADTKDFYLNKKMDQFEYMILKAEIPPQEIIEQ